MKFTKMEVTGQLDKQGAARFAKRIGLSYVIASLGVAAAGFASLIYAIKWW